MDKENKSGASATSELVKRAVRGDIEAFGELVRLYERFVYNLAFKFSFSEQDAYDISQEVLIKIWRSLPTFRFDCEFSTWVYRITHNTCLDYSRKKKRMPVVSMTDSSEEGESDERSVLDITDISAEPAECLLKKERIAAVREAIEQLMPEHREIIILRDMEDFSYLQISEMLALDIGTVKSRLSRARAKLKEILQSRNLL